MPVQRLQRTSPWSLRLSLRLCLSLFLPLTWSKKKTKKKNDTYCSTWSNGTNWIVAARKRGKCDGDRMTPSTPPDHTWINKWYILFCPSKYYLLWWFEEWMHNKLPPAVLRNFRQFSQFESFIRHSSYFWVTPPQYSTKFWFHNIKADVYLEDNSKQTWPSFPESILRSPILNFHTE